MSSQEPSTPAAFVKQAQQAASEALAAEDRGDIAKAIEKHTLVFQLYSTAAALSPNGKATLESMASMHERKADALIKGAIRQRIFSSRSNFGQQNFSSVLPSTTPLAVPSVVVSNSASQVNPDPSVDTRLSPNSPQSQYDPSLELSTSMMESVDSRYMCPHTFAAKNAIPPVSFGLDDSKYRDISSIILLSPEEEQREREKLQQREDQKNTELESGPTESLMFDPDEMESDDDAANQPISLLRKLIDLLPAFDFQTSALPTSSGFSSVQTPLPATPNSNVESTMDTQHVKTTFSEQRRNDDEEMKMLLEESLAQESDLLKSFYVFVPSEPRSDPTSPVLTTRPTTVPPATVQVTTPSDTATDATSTGYTSSIFGSLGLPSVVSHVTSTLQAYSPFSSISYLSSSSTPNPSPTTASTTASTADSVLANPSSAKNNVDPPPIWKRAGEQTSVTNGDNEQILEKLFTSVRALTEKNATLSQRVAQTQQMAEENEALKQSIIRFRKEAATLLQTHSSSNKRTGVYNQLSGSTMNPKICFSTMSRPRSNSGHHNINNDKVQSPTKMLNPQKTCDCCAEKVQKLENDVRELNLILAEKTAENNRLKELLKQRQGQ
eukprot:TRINITY_DN3167_c0_g1_i1.p1 TRINITY_DN3167_c0_g1~~TRINITY_DN3167_c0_g1_i1.p1  ORF type:complete len:609 (+),score=166.81 TRINITY_DN3167_c0_g1_i1:100-1926(+)